MIEIPLKDYQFTAILSLIGLLMWLPILLTNGISMSLGHAIVFAGGLLIFLFSLVATVICFFTGDHVRFKQ